MNSTVEYVDFNKICRLCLRKTEISPFFDLVTKHISNQNITFVEMLEHHVKFKVSKGDNKPQNVCNRCLSQIYQSYHFFEMCVVSNNVLDEALRHRNSNKKLETIDLTGPEHNLNPFNTPDKMFVKIIQEDQEPQLTDDTENDPLIEGDSSKLDKENVCKYKQNIEQFDYDNADVLEDSNNSLISNCEEIIIVKVEDEEGPPTLPKENVAEESNAKSLAAEEHNYSNDSSSTKKKKKVANTKTTPENRVTTLKKSRGRPSVGITRDQMKHFHQIGFTASQIAKTLNCSKSIIYTYCHKFGLKFRDKYTDISDEDLQRNIMDIHNEYPHSGSQMILRDLQAQGIVVPRQRVRSILSHVGAVS